MPEQGNGSLGTIAELVNMHRLVVFASGLCPMFRKYTRPRGMLPAPLFYLYQHEGQADLLVSLPLAIFLRLAEVLRASQA
jgi:hypothetical protein